MQTILKPCRVPWYISPTTGGATLTHEWDDDPKCTVVFGGGRMQADGRIVDCRVELTFRDCYHARTGPHDDNKDIESLGYHVERVSEPRMDDYAAWLKHEWLTTGICPVPRFYVATQSDWLSTLSDWFKKSHRHYVIYDRDGHIELIARGFHWREWSWTTEHREDASSHGAIVAEGEGVE